MSTDTRTLTPGALFVALKGERYDAHDFVAHRARARRDRGAGRSRRRRRHAADRRRRHARGARRARARGALAARARASIGITGSNGKTTVKTLTAAILVAPRPHARQRRQSQQRNRRAADVARDARARAVRGHRDGRRQARRHRLSRAHRAAGYRARQQRRAGASGAPGQRARRRRDQGRDLCGAAGATASRSSMPTMRIADYFVELAGARRIIRFGLDAKADVGATISTRAAASRCARRPARRRSRCRSPVATT